jgi:hypothetical protein
MLLRAIAVVFLMMTNAMFGAGICQTEAAEEKPVLEIPVARHDAGSHWEGELVDHSFEVKNSGTAELKILKVKPG